MSLSSQKFRVHEFIRVLERFEKNIKRFQVCKKTQLNKENLFVTIYISVFKKNDLRFKKIFFLIQRNISLTLQQCKNFFNLVQKFLSLKKCHFE